MYVIGLSSETFEVIKEGGLVVINFAEFNCSMRRFDLRGRAKSQSGDNFPEVRALPYKDFSKRGVFEGGVAPVISLPSYSVEILRCGGEVYVDLGDFYCSITGPDANWLYYVFGSLES